MFKNVWPAPTELRSTHVPIFKNEKLCACACFLLVTGVRAAVVLFPCTPCRWLEGFEEHVGTFVVSVGVFAEGQTVAASKNWSPA